MVCRTRRRGGRRPGRRSLLRGLALWALPAAALAQAPGADSAAPGDARRLAAYRAELSAFRREYGGAVAMPAVAFFQFGMGDRRKLIYKDGALTDGRTGAVVRRWPAAEATILPPAYTVSLALPNGGRVAVVEDARGVWVDSGGRRVALAGTERPVALPAFAEYRYPSVLRVLHHEVLMNVVDGRPVPNYLVYARPWYRDAAMMAMVLKATGNLALIRPWVLGLREPYDRNNAGEAEADNLGEALYLVSLVSDRRHPLVARVLAELPKYEVRTAAGVYVRGRSDFAEHPVYQTRWAKLGLRALGLPDPYVVPEVADPYAALFWMDAPAPRPAAGAARDAENYPYLGWAADHSAGVRRSPISDRDYPLTWERRASQARYDGVRGLDPRYAERQISAPHTWHAAEVFLYLTDRRAPTGP